MRSHQTRSLSVAELDFSYRKRQDDRRSNWRLYNWSDRPRTHKGDEKARAGLSAGASRTVIRWAFTWRQVGRRRRLRNGTSERRYWRRRVCGIHHKRAASRVFGGIHCCSSSPESPVIMSGGRCRSVWINKATCFLASELVFQQKWTFISGGRRTWGQGEKLAATSSQQTFNNSNINKPTFPLMDNGHNRNWELLGEIGNAIKVSFRDWRLLTTQPDVDAAYEWLLNDLESLLNVSS